MASLKQDDAQNENDSFNVKSEQTAEIDEKNSDSQVHQRVKSIRYKCEICDKDFTQKAYLKYHNDAKHKMIGRFDCNKCGKVLTTKISLKNHTEIVHEEGQRKKI